MTFFTLTLSLILILDPLGNVPIYAGILNPYPLAKQRKILIREMLISLVILIAFLYLGEQVLLWINISIPAIQVSGGLILFVIALSMIFPGINPSGTQDLEKGEPFIVPLSVPLVAGPSILAAIMAYSRQVENNLEMLFAIIIAWAFTAIILFLTPVFKKILKDKAMTACTRLMGLILTFIAIEMLLAGIYGFVTSSHKCIV